MLTDTNHNKRSFTSHSNKRRNIVINNNRNYQSQYMIESSNIQTSDFFASGSMVNI